MSWTKKYSLKLKCPALAVLGYIYLILPPNKIYTLMNFGSVKFDIKKCGTALLV